MKSNIMKSKEKLKFTKLQMMNFNKYHRLFFTFLVGIVVGSFVFNLFFSGYAHKLGIYSEYYINNGDIYRETVDKGSFFVYCIKKYIMEFIIVMLANITPFGMIFNYCYCAYMGCVVSVLISSATLTYGAGGLFIYIVSVFPHYILYIPYVVACIYVSLKTAEFIKEKNKTKLSLKALLVIILLAIGTAMLEVYVNYPILRAIFT